MTEHEARCLLLVQALESTPAGTLWAAADARWASQAADADAPAAAGHSGREQGASRVPRNGAWLASRTRHALERLRQRDATALHKWDQAVAGRAHWLWGLPALSLLAGLLLDQVGASQRIDLLSWPVWALVAWNGAVYAWMLAWALRGALRGARVQPPPRWGRWLAPAARTLPGGPLAAAAAHAMAAWAQAGARLHLARWAVALHTAAALLALGLIAGLYLRGLVLDYRAGWQSTFLQPAQVHALLHTALAPASAATGVAVPGLDVVAALRVVGPAVAASAPTASAVPWIHLQAATLLLAVVLPRLLLSAWAQLRAALWARAVPLAWLTAGTGGEDAYFRRLLAAATQVWLLPHGGSPAPAALLALHDGLRAALGDATTVQVAPATPYGAEDSVAAPPGTTPALAPPTQVLACFDFNATPEAEVQGRFIGACRRLAPGAAVVAWLDDTAWQARFAHLPDRTVQRRAAWQAWADASGVALATRPDELARALGSAS